MRNAITAAMIAGLGLAAGAAHAQDPISLKFSNLWPEGHFLWTEGGKYFADALARETEGKVTVEGFHASQLGKDQLSLLSSNIAQMATVAVPYAAEKMPLSGVSELPGIFTSSCEGTMKAWALAQEGGLLAKNELDALGLHVLFIGLPPPYKVMTTGKKVASLEDLAGLKLRTVGGAQADTARALGAVPVQVQAGELYDSLARGTIDGALYIWVGVPPFDLQNQIKHSVEGAPGGAATVLYAINKKTWDEMTSEVQDAMTRAGAETQQHLCAHQDAEENPLRDTFVAENGLTVTTLTEEEAARWREAMAGVAAEWAAKMDANGRAGTEVLEAFKAAGGGN